MCESKRHLQEEEHSHNLKGRVDFAGGLDLVPFVGHKVGSPDADWCGVPLRITDAWKCSGQSKKDRKSQSGSDFPCGLQQREALDCTRQIPAAFVSGPLPVNEENIHCHLKDQLMEELNGLKWNRGKTSHSVSFARALLSSF